MKILHLYHKNYNSGDGITTCVANLTKHQNLIPFVTSEALAFSADDKVKQKKEFNITSFLGVLSKVKQYSPDVIYIHGVFRIHVPIFISVLKLMKFKVILVPHCSLMKKTISYKNKKKTLYLNFFNKLSFKYIDAIHFLNDEEKNNSLLISNRIPMYILPNGVEIIDTKKEKDFRSIKPFYLGRCDINHKGLDILVKGLNLFHKENDMIVFNMYGINNSQYHVFNQLNPNDKIIVHPPIFNKEKNDVLENNNVFILTSRYEGLPISVLEALSYGNICLVTEGTNMASIIEEYNCGFLIKEASDICFLIDKLNEMPKSILVGMSNNAKKLVVERYDWNIIASKSIDIINRIIQS